MTDHKHISHAFYLALVALVIFAASRFLGGILFDNNWSFVHLAHLPGWYSVAWIALLGGLGFLLVSRGEFVAGFFTSRLQVLIAAAVILGLTIVFQHDSFLLGGGNMRVAQIAQAPKIIFRWFEFGATMLVSWFYAVFSLFDMPRSMPAVVSWKLLAFLSTAAALVGCIKLAMEFTHDAIRRVFLFVIMFAGPQMVVYFGFVGVEPVAPAITCWVAWAAVRLNRHGTGKNLALVWILTIVGMFLQVWLIYLLPAAIFVTARHLSKDRNRLSNLTLLSGLIACLALFAIIYVRGFSDFEFSRFILFLHGKPPFGDYSLFSVRHISDVMQVFLLTVPAIIVTKYLWMRRLSALRTDANLVTLSLMTLAGGAVMVITDPVHSIVFDLPRLVVYMTPMSLLTGLLLADVPLDFPNGRRLLGVMAALALIVPMSYLPVLLKIDNTESYASEYFDKHEAQYLHAGLAFRDAYFYRRHLDERKQVIRIPGHEQVSPESLTPDEDPLHAALDTSARANDTITLDTTNLEKANQWEWMMPSKSSDYLNLRGIGDLIASDQPNEALRMLYRIKAKRPYWAEARATLVSVLVQLGRYAQARPEIDTCLMLEPHSRVHHMNNYICYRDQKQFYEALKAVTRASELFPGDPEILTDLMIIHYRAGNSYEADTLAMSLMTSDPTLPYPYLIKGFLEDKGDNMLAAVRHYEKFVSLAPDEPETVRIRKRLNDLTAQLRKN